MSRGVEGVFFSGKIKNTHSDYLITFLQLEVIVFGEEGNEQTLTAHGNVWAAPFDEIEVDFRFSQIVEPEIIDVEWCDRDTAHDERRSCKSWDVVHVAGVPI